MKPLLDWQSAEVVNIYDETSLWAAPFGKLLLDNIPMQRGWDVLDIGFGTGYPLVELAQRFGPTSVVTGIDIWEAAIARTREKIRVCGLENIRIVEQDAAKMPFEAASFDLITSNLGVNNFAEKEAVIAECKRVLKPGGSIAITTNVEGTFNQLFAIFHKCMEKLNLEEPLQKLQQYIEHRSTIIGTIALFEEKGFTHTKTVEDEACFRFVDAQALFNHSLIRIGFRAGWENLLAPEDQERFFELATRFIDDHIAESGEIRLEVPVVYLAFGA